MPSNRDLLYCERVHSVPDHTTIAEARGRCNRFSPVIARLAAENEPELAGLLRSLDARSRINRFGHAASDASVQAHARRALSTAAYMAGAFADNRLVGVAEVFDRNPEGISEVAFAVHQGWRRLGFASALLENAKGWARRSSVTTLRMVISPSNWPMRALAQKAGARLDLSLDEIYADVALAEWSKTNALAPAANDRQSAD